jgi:hypothetical protein
MRCKVDQDDMEDFAQYHNSDLKTEDLQELDSFNEHDCEVEEQGYGNTMLTSENRELLETLCRDYKYILKGSDDGV